MKYGSDILRVYSCRGGSLLNSRPSREMTSVRSRSETVTTEFPAHRVGGAAVHVWFVEIIVTKGPLRDVIVQTRRSIWLVTAVRSAGRTRRVRTEASSSNEVLLKERQIDCFKKARCKDEFSKKWKKRTFMNIKRLQHAFKEFCNFALLLVIE